MKHFSVGITCPPCFVCKYQVSKYCLRDSLCSVMCLRLIDIPGDPVRNMLTERKITGDSAGTSVCKLTGRLLPCTGAAIARGRTAVALSRRSVNISPARTRRQAPAPEGDTISPARGSIDMFAATVFSENQKTGTPTLPSKIHPPKLSRQLCLSSLKLNLYPTSRLHCRIPRAVRAPTAASCAKKRFEQMQHFLLRDAACINRGSASSKPDDGNE